MRSYGSSAKHFDAESITDLQDMTRCFGNMSDYYQARGSPVTQIHFAAVQKFALSLTTDECGEGDVIIAAVKWLDGVNQKFMSCLSINVEYGTETHFAVTSTLKKTNPKCLRKLQVVINQRRLPAAASTKRKPEANGANATNNKKKTTTDKLSSKVSDRGIVDLLPKHNGQGVCLRHLSESGCWSKIEGKCTADDRCHFVPDTKLPASVEKFMVAKGWGGVSSKFPHLKP